jgi:hypothetical protein
MTPPPRFRLIHVFYVMALLGASLATCGVAGVVVFWIVAVGWNMARSHYDVTAEGPRGRKAFISAFVDVAAFVAITGMLLVLLMPDHPRRSTPTRSDYCRNNLKQIALELHSYHDDHGSFPPAFIADKAGKPMHSWRALILPYLEGQHVYDRYRFDEPWDGPNNRRLRSEMPECYRCAVHDPNGQSSQTSYLAVVGERTAWLGDESRRLTDFADGAESTILVLEGPPKHVEWMAPDDLTPAEAQRLLMSSPADHGKDASGFWKTARYGRSVAFVDGSIRGLRRGMPAEVAFSFLRIGDASSGSERERHFSGGYDAYETSTKWANVFRLTLLVLLIALPYPWMLSKGKSRPSAPAGDDDSSPRHLVDFQNGSSRPR